MHIRGGERLRLTLWGARDRAVISINTFAVTEPAIEGMTACEDGFVHDVTRWLVVGHNILTLVLIGAPGPVPFRLVLAQDGHDPVLVAEDEMLAPAEPWRFWSLAIERSASVMTYGEAVALSTATSY